MIKHRLLPFVILIMLFAVPSLEAANLYRIEFATNFGSTDNLLDDSSKIYDAYNTSTVKFSMYPLPAVEFSFGGQNSVYREMAGLSSVTGQIGFTCIPTPRTSKLALYLSGNFSGIRYHNAFNGFDNNIGDMQIAAGYNISPTISTRAGISYSSTSYISLNVEKKNDLEFFWGGNATLPADVGFDIETGFARANYSNIDKNADTSNPFVPIAVPDTMPRVQSDLWVFYYSPRISRVIGPKTGLNINFTRRIFQNYNDQVIFGFSTQFLSPWASVWEGQSITAALKSFLIPRFIFTAGAGYWDKTYLKTLEERHTLYITLLLDQHNRRRDYQTKYYLSLQYPMTFHSGLYLEPSARLDYTKNISTEPLFTYNDYSYSMMITMRF